MSAEFRIARADRVPSDADVSHFDQLDETAQRHLADAVRDRNLPATVTVDRGTFGDLDLVKFTEYYRIEAHPAADPRCGSVVGD